MNRFTACYYSILTGFLLFPLKSHAAIESIKVSPQVAGFIEARCVKCHNEKKHKGDTRHDTLPGKTFDGLTAQRYQDILDVINAGEMPPEDVKQPSDEEVTAFLDALTVNLSDACKALSDTGGRMVMRRLNRREYMNTMRELLGTEIKGDSVPSDDKFKGFDTVGSAQEISSFQLENYLTEARLTLRRVFAAEKEFVPLKITRNDLGRANDTQLLADIQGWKRGIAELEHILATTTKTKFVKSDFKNLKTYNVSSLNSYQEYGLEEVRKLLNGHQVYLKRDTGYLEDESLRTGYVARSSHAINIPSHKMPHGNYLCRIALGAEGEQTDEMLDVRAFFGRRTNGALSDPGMGVNDEYTFKITGHEKSPQVIEIPLTMSPHHTSRMSIKIRGTLGKHAPVSGLSSYKQMWIDWIEWEGPIANVDDWNPAKGYNLIFFKDFGADESDDYAREILKRFAFEAYRRQDADQDFIEKLFAFYKQRRERGMNFENALLEPLTAILASPRFLYLSENDMGSDSRELTDRELAIRLSYFIWSTPPDEELYTLAASGKLRDEKILTAQLDRMLASPKTEAFTNSFVDQWLELERFEGI
ncbi:MAG: DUF1592 domain-containing protein [Verrucomicrobia bacterium]|nr:DUF1592 domain-containing protein [Verrucomicrobiota bacterium]MDA0723056.1 DUF1592 domain-containing protein [Verrucomicrobiota bacterium]MDA1045704.1 DUF1592 domain-containing protein [Verrucomicrobiota bacterium]